MLKKEAYTAYFNAVKKIVIDGEPVNNLDEIREQCDEAFMQSIPEGSRKNVRGYTASAIVVSFTAEAENRILRGEDPVVVYDLFGKPLEYRENCRRILKDALDDFF